MLMNHSSLNINGIGKIKLNSSNSQSDNNTNQNNNEDEDGEDRKANILLNGDDLNGDDLIDFGNIPSESAHLTVVAPPSLPPPLPNHTSSSSGNYSDSSSLSLSSSSSCSSSTHSANESLSSIEFEIIKSIESLIDEYSWSAKSAQPDTLLLECNSCDFIINVTYFVHKFKHKLDQNLAYNLNTLNNSTHDPLKECTELIQLYLAKLIHIILVRHNCHQTDHADDFLLIKNFFKQLNKHDSNCDASTQLSINDLLSLIRFKFNEYLNQIMPEFRFDLTISEFKSDNCNDASELIDCCALNEEDALLANLDNLMDDAPNNDRINQVENYDNQFSVTNYDEPQSLNFSSGSSATTAPNNNDDNSSILKAINKRKLHLSCPICGSCVVNMSDHLVKKHSIRDRNQRKCLMDVVRRTYINESKVQSSKESEPSQKKNTPIAHDSSQSASSTQPAQPQVFTNASNRKFIKCPICLDDNKYFVNISDHLIKIHHLITSDARKPVLRQIKENSLNFNLSKSDFDSMNASATNSFKPSQQAQQAQDKLTEPLNSYNNYQNELILNENIANGSIVINNNDESIYTNDENNRQCSNSTSTTASTSNPKRKPFKAKKLKNSSLNISSNNNNNNNEETLRLSNYTQDNQTENDENENENEEDETLIQDEDDDYCDLIAMNCQSLEANTHLVEHNFNEINQFAPSENEFFANASSVSSSRETIANKRKQQNESSLVEKNNGNCYLKTNDKSKKQKLSPKSLKQQQYDLVLFNEATVVNCLNTSASGDMQQDFEINEDAFTYQPSNSQKCTSQLQAVNIKQLSPSIYSCTSPSRSNSATSVNTNATTTLNTAHLDSLWSKFSTMESNLSRQVREFSVLSESIMKQLQQFSAQFETAVSELDSFKKTLVEATALDEHNNNNNNNNREIVKPKSNPTNFINSTNNRRLNEFSPFTKQKQTNNNFRQAKQTNVEQVMSQFSHQQQQQQQPQ